MNPDALYLASRIHRQHEPRDWPDAIARLDSAVRGEVETYLRGIAARMRVVRDPEVQRKAAVANARRAASEAAEKAKEALDGD